MKLLALIATFVVAASAVPTTPLPRQAATCTNPIVRKEWRALSVQERKNYVSAVVCLFNTKSKAPADKIPGARHRYDDFNAVHITSSGGLDSRSGGIHMVGHFLAWHRYYIATYESILRSECGYKGAVPYWNWSIDAESTLPVTEWDVFNPDHGLGGTGNITSTSNPSNPWSFPVAGCVASGPFVGLVNNVGPNSNVKYNPHCLHRAFNELIRFQMVKANTDIALNAKTFVEFDRLVEMGGSGMTGNFHGAGHFIVGGDANDFMSSSSEPTFFLHHTYLDYLYWQWQMRSPEKRLSEVGGNLKPNNPSGGNVTGETPLDIHWLAPVVPLKETFNIKAGVLCYDYE